MITSKASLVMAGHEGGGQSSDPSASNSKESSKSTSRFISTKIADLNASAKRRISAAMREGKLVLDNNRSRDPSMDRHSNQKHDHHHLEPNKFKAIAPQVERASSEVLYPSITSSIMSGSSTSSSNFARSRRSLAEPSNKPHPPSAIGGVLLPSASSTSLTMNTTNNGSTSNIYEDIDKYQQQPPMLAPVSGVPNLKGKVIRPIAFRPTPGNAGFLSASTTPTNSMGFRSYNGGGSSHATPTPGTPAGGNPMSASYHAGLNGISSNPFGPPSAGGRNVPQPPQGHNQVSHNPNQQPQVNSEGFAPGHPLIKDGRRHYGSSQELHSGLGPGSLIGHHPSLNPNGLHQPQPGTVSSTSSEVGVPINSSHYNQQNQNGGSSSSFNKFNSLDRRTLLSRRNVSNFSTISQNRDANNYPPGRSASASSAHSAQVHFNGPLSGQPESLPVPSSANNPSHGSNNTIYSNTSFLKGLNNRFIGGRDRLLQRTNSNSNTNNYSTPVTSKTSSSNQQQPASSSAMNTNGLPSSNTSKIVINQNSAAANGNNSNYQNAEQIYANNLSLRQQQNNQNGSRSSSVNNNQPGTRFSGAGTPQFQNLSGSVLVKQQPQSSSSSSQQPQISQNNSSSSGVGNASSDSSSKPTSSHRHHHGKSRSYIETARSASSSSSGVSVGAKSGGSGNSGGFGDDDDEDEDEEEGEVIEGREVDVDNGQEIPPKSSSSSGEKSTPSPSGDSAVGIGSDNGNPNLESTIKDRDTEINYLRETMEQNEQAHEEKEKIWERELRKIKGLYENRLRASQQKFAKMEQALSNQNYQLQNEKRKLEMELDEIRRESDRGKEESRRLKDELKRLRDHRNHPESPGSYEIPSPSAESSSSSASGSSANGIELRLQLSDLRRELERKSNLVAELEKTKASLTAEMQELRKKKENGESLVDDDFDDDSFSISELSARKEIILARDRQIDQLESELRASRERAQIFKNEADRFRGSFESEKAAWLDEKEKVIRYQKQLQLNYVQMYKKNKTLEGEYEVLQRASNEQRARVSALEAALSKTSAGKKLKSSSDLNLASSSSSSNGAAGGSSGAKVKKSNSVRAKFFRMSLHSESHC